MNKKGFTLIELLVTVIIVGVLTALAVPIFRQNVKRVMATEGYILVGSIKTAERIYFSEHNTYTANWGDISGQIDLGNNKYFNSIPILTSNGTGSDATFTAIISGSGEASGISMSIGQTGDIVTSNL